MKKVLITNMSSKGQVVIPSQFRKSLGLSSGAPLAVYTDGSTLLFKPIEMPDEETFKKLLKETRQATKAAGFKQNDLKKLIKRVRNESSS